MTIKQSIISFLQSHPDGADDDELANILSLSARQQANSRCRELEKEGLVARRLVNGKIRNFWTDKAVINVPLIIQAQPVDQTTLPKYEYWFWEGNIQSKVIDYLTALGYIIHSFADTASHQKGIDIVAEKDGKPLWVSVKGYPLGTKKTKPVLQAGHWFKHAIFDIIEYRERDKNVSLAIALPDYPRYHSFAQKVSWLKPTANFTYYWVKESGEVTID
jgi:hypothetical protein